MYWVYEKIKNNPNELLPFRSFYTDKEAITAAQKLTSDWKMQCGIDKHYKVSYYNDKVWEN